MSLIRQCENTINQFIKISYPWLHCPTTWEGIVDYFQHYRPILYVLNIIWRLSEVDQIKYKYDGASKGNSGESSYAFYVRDHKGDLMLAEPHKIGVATNSKVETITILRCLRYCVKKSYARVILETDSLSMKNILTRQ